MAKPRTSRWDDRSHLKFMANRRGDKKAMHPQVRRLEDDADDQVTDLVAAGSEAKSKPLESTTFKRTQPSNDYKEKNDAKKS